MRGEATNAAQCAAKRQTPRDARRSDKRRANARQH
jgi:hypothetical protein